MWVGEADGKTFSKFSAFNYFCFNRFFPFIIVFEWGEFYNAESEEYLDTMMCICPLHARNQTYSLHSL